LVADAGAAGKYRIQATSTTGAVSTLQQVDVSAGNLIDVNFSF
jgi:hypothetical protein